RRRLFAVLVTCSLCFFSTEAFSQNKFSLHLQDVSLQAIVEEIERTSDYVFVFSEDILEEIEQADSIQVSNVSIDTLLAELFFDLGLQYRLLDKQIVVY